MDVDTRSIEGVLAERFKIDPPPTLVGRASAGAPIVFSRLRSKAPQRGRSMSVPAEDAFAFQVPLRLPFYSGLWIAGRRVQHTSVSLGDVFLFDLSTNPTVGLDAMFDSVRLYIPNAALDALSLENGLARVHGLKARTFGGSDTVLYGLTQALVGAMEQPGRGGALFAEYLSLAFHSHVIHTYGSVVLPSSQRQSGLTAWQLRRAKAFIDARVVEDPTLTQIAAECGLSARYFARAFKKSTGMPPHRWLMIRRLDRAKGLLATTNMGLTDVAAACGFYDQSYFTRTFTKYEGISPGRWRHERRKTGASVGLPL